MLFYSIWFQCLMVNGLTLIWPLKLEASRCPPISPLGTLRYLRGLDFPMRVIVKHIHPSVSAISYLYQHIIPTKYNRIRVLSTSFQSSWHGFQKAWIEVKFPSHSCSGRSELLVMKFVCGKLTRFGNWFMVVWMQLVGWERTVKLQAMCSFPFFSRFWFSVWTGRGIFAKDCTAVHRFDNWAKPN